MPTGRVALVCALAIGAGVLGWRGFTPVAPFDVHISGDGSAQITGAIFGPGDLPRADDPATAALEVVTFRRWQNIETMTDLMRVCGAACDGSAPVVVLRRPSLNGLTKVLFIDLGAQRGGPALDAGEPMEEITLNCVGRLISRHLHPRRTIDSRVGCAPDDRERIVLRPRLWTPRPL